MKKIILNILLLVSFANINAQKVLTHIVQKGEDIEFLANSYNTTPDKIREWNNLSANEEIAVGYPLSIHITNEDASAATIPLQNYTVRDNGLTEVIYLIQKGKYKDARKLCDKNLSENNSGNLYYLRGLCYLQDSKLSKAKEDLQRASASSDLADAFENDCDQLLENAEQYIKEKKERRSQMWAGILVGVAAVGQATVQQMQQNQQNQQMIQGQRSYSGQSLTDRISNPNGTLKAGVFDADMNAFVAKSAMQVNQQWMQEYQQFCMYNKKPDGSNFTYDEWLNMRYANSNQTGSGSSSDINEGTYSQNDYSNPRQIVTESDDCPRCYGTGICQTCDGAGYCYNKFDMSKTFTCPNCDKNNRGKCAACHGTKKVSHTRVK